MYHHIRLWDDDVMNMKNIKHVYSIFICIIPTMFIIYSHFHISGIRLLFVWFFSSSSKAGEMFVQVFRPTFRWGEYGQIHEKTITCQWHSQQIFHYIKIVWIILSCVTHVQRCKGIVSMSYCFRLEPIANRNWVIWWWMIFCIVYIYIYT